MIGHGLGLESRFRIGLGVWVNIVKGQGPHEKGKGCGWSVEGDNMGKAPLQKLGWSLKKGERVALGVGKVKCIQGCYRGFSQMRGGEEDLPFQACFNTK